MEEYRYKDVVVPVGFVTNGADIPRVFWSFYPPNRSDYLPAVIVHDYLCWMAKKTDDDTLYEKADEYFKEILEALGISEFDVFVLHGGVRFYSVCVRPFVKKWCRGKIGGKSVF
ncbi:hypothetical protein MNB_SV-14-1023 [hydrothermal vent metagenome]|uniref:DUF1353 domain-containing protein n=1 Tax=hydrothermal vent metagenome TaxID=652676 RepID=A0A1W1CCT5_9ZZZZ